VHERALAAVGDAGEVARVLELLPEVPPNVSGRDEAHTGDMWNRLGRVLGAGASSLRRRRGPTSTARKRTRVGRRSRNSPTTPGDGSPYRVLRLYRQRSVSRPL
jgi:hypothetical protein